MLFMHTHQTKAAHKFIQSDSHVTSSLQETETTTPETFITCINCAIKLFPNISILTAIFHAKEERNKQNLAILWTSIVLTTDILFRLW